MAWDAREADKAATEAENELNDLPDEAVNPVADWWHRWFMKTGHKRLGRILTGIAKENLKKGGKQQ